MVHPRVKNKPPMVSKILHFAKSFRLAAVGGLIVLLFLLMGTLASLVAPFDPIKMNLRHSMEPPGTQYLLGTDYGGRDLLSRTIYGARISLLISLSSVLFGATAGVTLGVVAAWQKRLQNPIMRLMDIMLSFPSIIVALMSIFVMSSGLANLIIVIGINNIPVFARLAYGKTLSVKNFTHI